MTPAGVLPFGAASRVSVAELVVDRSTEIQSSPPPPPPSSPPPPGEGEGELDPDPCPGFWGEPVDVELDEPPDEPPSSEDPPVGAGESVPGCGEWVGPSWAVAPWSGSGDVDRPVLGAATGRTG